MDLIDESPMRPGWGRIWQGGEFVDIYDIAPPHAVISLIGALFHSGLSVSRFLNDTDEAVLSDAELLAMVGMTLSMLKQGFNIYIHCFEGKYRSSYLDVAVHMAVLNYPYDQAFGLVKRMHPIADMRKGTEAQLRRMEKTLKEVTC